MKIDRNVENGCDFLDSRPELLIPDGYSEDAIALYFSQRYANELLWVNQWKKWYLWDGMRWVEDLTVTVLDLTRHLCRQLSADDNKQSKIMRQAAYIAAVERLARSDRRHAAVPEQFDADEFLLNTPAGIVDLQTGNILDSDRERYITKLTSAALGEKCPRWIQFLERTTGGDVELLAFLQRVCGYCLTGSTREHALFFFYGSGTNGKSTFISTLNYVLGDYSTVSAMDTFVASATDRHPADLAILRGARLVTAHETDQGKRWDETRIKILTGGDPISARFMRRDFFTFIPTFKLILAGNHKPQLRSVDQAIRRRLHLIPFLAFITPEERDPDLLKKLRAEAGGILQWAIEGCLLWQKYGLKPPPVVVDATNEYIETQDSLAAWIEDCCDTGPNNWETPAALFARWKEWAEKSGEYVGNLRVFGDRLETAGFPRNRSHGTRKHLGLKLRNATE